MYFAHKSYFFLESSVLKRSLWLCFCRGNPAVPLGLQIPNGGRSTPNSGPGGRPSSVAVQAPLRRSHTRMAQSLFPTLTTRSSASSVHALAAPSCATSSAWAGAHTAVWGGSQTRGPGRGFYVVSIQSSKLVLQVCVVPAALRRPSNRAQPPKPLFRCSDSNS